MSQEVREILWTRKTAMQEVREILWTSTSGYTVTSNDPGNVAMLSLQNLPWHLGVVCVCMHRCCIVTAALCYRGPKPLMLVNTLKQLTASVLLHNIWVHLGE